MAERAIRGANITQGRLSDDDLLGADEPTGLTTS